MPSWGAPQDQPALHALQSARKRKAVEMDFYEGEDDTSSLAPYRPSGRTLGGNRPAGPPYTGNTVELRPAYVPKTVTQIPAEQMQLAIPAIKAHQILKWDQEGEDAEIFEWRNFEDRTSKCAVIQH